MKFMKDLNNIKTQREVDDAIERGECDDNGASILNEATGDPSGRASSNAIKMALDLQGHNVLLLVQMKRSLLRLTARTARKIGASSTSYAWQRAMRRAGQRALRQKLKSFDLEVE